MITRCCRILYDAHRQKTDSGGNDISISVQDMNVNTKTTGSGHDVHVRVWGILKKSKKKENVTTE